MRSLVLFAAMLTIALGHKEYRDRIPNGHKVYDPCHPDDPKKLWLASGHTHPDEGKHGENQFGKDFKKHGHKHWNREICQMDSDGDGMTNGAELGDPDCTWTPGKHIEPTQRHPGICEPLNSAKCGHSFRC